MQRSFTHSKKPNAHTTCDVVVHAYQKIDLTIVRNVIDHGLSDVLAFADLMIEIGD